MKGVFLYFKNVSDYTQNEREKKVILYIINQSKSAQ